MIFKNKFGRIKAALVATGLAACLVLAACAGQKKQEPQGDDKSLGVYNIRQIVADNNKSKRTVMWENETKQEYSLELRTIGSNAHKTYKAGDYSFKDGKGEYKQYGILLEGLSANSAYEYRITTSAAKGSWHKLQTDGGERFKALIFPDSQCSDYSHWQKLAQGAYNSNKDANLFLHIGDLTDNGEDNYQWQQWFKGIKGFAENIPMAATIGNHEAYTLDWKFRLPKAYTQLFNFPDNGLDKYKNQFYSFDYGPVHFTVIDTNYDKETKEFQPDLLREQLAWLEADLAQAKNKWKIVLQHKDILLYKFGPDSGREAKWDTHYTEVGRLLMPIYEKYNVDAVLSGHLHTYRRRVPLRNFKPDSAGITYILTGVAGNVQYAKLWDNWENDAARAPYPETMNYLTLEADTEKLYFACFLPDGKKIDEVTINKRQQ